MLLSLVVGASTALSLQRNSIAAIAVVEAYPDKTMCLGETLLPGT